MINAWTKRSIEIANQSDYLDKLYNVYPINTNSVRQLSSEISSRIKLFFANEEYEDLLKLLLKLEIFPIKDSYVAYFKKDPRAIERNPATTARLIEALKRMGIRKILENTKVPKETNRQMGPLFKNWVNTSPLDCPVTSDSDIFINSSLDMIYNTSDSAMQSFANKYLGYERDKGLDFIGRFKERYIIGEAKFLTDFGGHQNAQFEDALSTLVTKLQPTKYKVNIIAILDGVLYIESKNKMHIKLLEYAKKYNILSAVLLNEFVHE